MLYGSSRKKHIRSYYIRNGHGFQHAFMKSRTISRLTFRGRYSRMMLVRNASVAQWIEQWPPEPCAVVRFHSDAHDRLRCDSPGSPVCHGKPLSDTSDRAANDPPTSVIFLQHSKTICNRSFILKRSVPLFCRTRIFSHFVESQTNGRHLPLEIYRPRDVKQGVLWITKHLPRTCGCMFFPY